VKEMTHELNSIMILIHPPLAILGYLFTFLSLKKVIQLTFRKGNHNAKEIKNKEIIEKDLKISLTIAFGLTFLGLVTGMIWAQLAWNRFWSWDPKETATLFVFLTLTAALILHRKKTDIKWMLISLILNVLIIIGSILISYLGIGLHSFG
jgi:ABC-type transport system involved in cytochrome c biogenesis permease subunit